MYTKTITYDRETRDFAMYLDGELVGYEATRRAAEDALDALVYELLRRGNVAPPAPAPDAAPAPADVAAACLAIAEECRDAAAGHTAQGNGEAARDLAAAARAATKAAFYAVEPERARWVGSTLLVSSATAGGVVHAVTPAGCSCEAGGRGRPCWHAALRQGHERAEDLRGADGDARAALAAA